MATTTQQPQTKVLESLETSKITASELVKKTGRPLGSPINSRTEGEQFEVTLSGKIEIREFQGVKGAYYMTKEGYSIKVNAAFDPAVHKEGSKHPAICRVFKNEDTGRETKFCALVD